MNLYSILQFSDMYIYRNIAYLYKIHLECNVKCNSIEIRKSDISLAGNVPESISVLSYVMLKPNLVISEIGYPN